MKTVCEVCDKATDHGCMRWRLLFKEETNCPYCDTVYRHRWPLFLLGGLAGAVAIIFSKKLGAYLPSETWPEAIALSSTVLVSTMLFVFLVMLSFVALHPRPLIPVVIDGKVKPVSSWNVWLPAILTGVAAWLMVIFFRGLS